MGSIIIGYSQMYIIQYFHTAGYRGESFWKVFIWIGKVRSLLHLAVKIMALTATATWAWQLVQLELHVYGYQLVEPGLKDPYVLTTISCKANLIYSVGIFKTVEKKHFVLWQIGYSTNRLLSQKQWSMPSHLECVLRFITISKSILERALHTLNMH